MSWHHRRLQVPLGLLGPQPWRCLFLSEEPCSETETEKWPHPSPQFTEASCRGHGSNLDCPCIWVARKKHIYFRQLKLSISFSYKRRGQAAAERAVSALIRFRARKAGWAEVFQGHLCSPRCPNHSNEIRCWSLTQYRSPLFPGHTFLLKSSLTLRGVQFLGNSTYFRYQRGEPCPERAMAPAHDSVPYWELPQMGLSLGQAD